jgi:hypothetical protein
VHQELRRETHHSLATIGLYQGLISIFDGYVTGLDELYLAPSKIPDRVARLSARLGHPFAPREDTIDFFRYDFMKYLPQHEMTKAFTYFRMNTVYYPVRRTRG